MSSRDPFKELEAAVLRGLKINDAVRVHPNYGVEDQVVQGNVVGWHTGWGPDMVDVRISEDTVWSVPRFSVISVEAYDQFKQWEKHSEAEVKASF